MNFDLTDDQIMFRDTVARFGGAFDLETRRRTRAQPGGLDRARWEELRAIGLLALPATEAQGGLGGSITDCAVVAEALGRAVAPEPWLELAYWPLRLLATVASSGAARSIVSEGRKIAVAFAEPRRRYRSDPIDTRCLAGRVSGAKTFVLGGEAADAYLVTALGNDQPGIYLVESAGLDCRPYTLVDGGRAVELRLHEAAAQYVGEFHWTVPIAETRLVAAAEMLGLAGRLFDETLAYVRQREQFGQPLGRFQVLQHRLVDCYARLEQMRSLLYRALIDAEAGRWSRAAGTKAFIAERALAIGHEAIQMHGGMGVTDELVVGHAHKRILLLSRLFGDVAADLETYAEAA